ncbi:MAG: Crp/Fnr family transcriptional regulator [Cyanobacteriota bacterium]|nr:Crp/Fnr family transcriptional regulator [Cyanobacteriota bacterium]
MPFDKSNEEKANRLLAALSSTEYERLLPDFKEVCLENNQVIYQSNEEITEVYFPLDALVSIVSTLKDGSTTEIAVVGNQGMVGLPAFWGGSNSIVNTVVQVAGSAIKLSASKLRSECSRKGELEKLLQLYTQALFAQIAQNAACSSHHKIEKRLARWLLTVGDCIPQHELPLTQEFMASMLGVRRSGVTQAAGMLQKAQIIHYVRGKITILDRERLEENSCECYQVVKQEYKRLFDNL